MTSGLDPRTGGPPASVVATALALRGQGVLNSLAYVDVPGQPAEMNVETLRSAGVEIHRFPVTRATGTPGVRWGISLRLAVWLLRNAHRFDVLHMHGAWTFTAVAGLTAARLRRRTAVLSAHESLTDFDRKKCGPLKRSIKRVVRRAYLALFDLIVVSSSLELQDSGDPTGRRSVVIPHAVLRIKRTAPTTKDGALLRVGFLGRLHPKKNLALLIEAIASVDQDVLLVVAGEGPTEYAEELRHVAGEVGLTDRIAWLGFVDPDAKRAFLSSIDVLAMPSAYECFGVAAVEAMSAGVPVIVSPTVGISEAVARYGAGVVAVPDRDSLAAAVERFAVDRAFLERAAGASRSAATEFSLKSHGARLQREYFRLLSSRDKPLRGAGETAFPERSKAVRS